MEEKQGQVHKMNFLRRQEGHVTGVTDVIAFDSNQILLETTEGMLTIQGSDLHVSRLHIENGEVDISGKVNSLIYTENGSYRKKQKGSLLKRMFE